MTKIRDLLAKNMKSYRIAQGFTQAYLAEKVETSTHYIGMIENRSKFPSPEMIERIAAALGIDTTDLFKTEKKIPEAIKTYREATIKDIKSLLGRFLDDKLADLKEQRE
jgi:transcriptional regulator with XRE-family HTH domain